MDLSVGILIGAVIIFLLGPLNMMSFKKTLEMRAKDGSPEYINGKFYYLVEEGKRGEFSDGYHTFKELYYHRMVLFATVCEAHASKAWKSWKHHDGTMYDDYFIVGIETPTGQYTYHYHKDYWYIFEVKELDFAPEWDGHKPEDVIRLYTL